ncbi:MAG: VWA domain-containing protein [Pyrinomonadaceae bacterium]|nr:VWA domain-containing protein [Pyrinomonadaceae bacterium]
MTKNLLYLTGAVLLIFSSIAQGQTVTNPSGTPIPAPTPQRDRIAQPQQTPPSQTDSGEDDDEVLKVSSNLIVVPVSVTDDKGQSVMNLTTKDFRLAEDSRQQEISQISNADQVPLEIAVLVDVSGSLNTLFEFEKQAAARFLEKIMRPEDRAAIFLISENPKLIQQRDTVEKSAATIRAVEPAKKFTAFYDTVMEAARYLKQNAQPRSRRVVLVISDGEDNYSDITRNSEIAAYREVSKDLNTMNSKKLAQVLLLRTEKAHQQAQAAVLRDLQNADTVFYAINPTGDSYKLNRISTRAQNALKTLSDETGGTAFLPKNDGTNLEQIFQQIASELRAQYLLQYYSDANFQTGKYVKLDVNLANRANLKVRARQGYFAKTQ